MNPKITPELLAARPALAEDPTARHPAVAPVEPEGGPPRRYSIGLHNQIIQNIEAGNRPHVAAGMAGLPSHTFYAWMRRGKQGDPWLAQFAEDVEVATHVAEGKALKVITDTFAATATGEDHLRDARLAAENAKWTLERTRADGYSKEANAKVNAMLAEFFQRLEHALPPEIFQMVIAAASGQAIGPTERAQFQLSAAPEEDE